MDNIKRVSDGGAKHHPSSAKHKRVQKSTTLNRKFVRQPKAQAKVVRRGETDKEALARRQALASKMNRERLALSSKKQVVKPLAKQQAVAGAQKDEQKVQKKTVDKAAEHPTVAVAKARVAAGKAAAPRQLSAQELKDRAIKQALQRVATMGDDAAGAETQMTKRRGWRKRKLVLAVGMAAVSIAMLGYLVHLNFPDLSVKVAAMQSGIDGAYPSYVPREYRMDGLVADNAGKITISFAAKSGNSFTLVQEKSSWDSMSVLSQYVVPNWGDDYSTIKEQGLTIYVSGSDAVWVNGGVLYLIDDAENGLTKQQLHDIAISL